MSVIQFRHAESQPERLACFDLMRALRPHLADAPAFAAQVQRQAAAGYRLLAARQDAEVVGLAGYRLLENLLYGRFAYVDDLVVADGLRSHGIGQRLLDAVRDEAVRADCAYLVLDTGLANAMAQRFYFRSGLLSKGLHFCQPIQAA
ncbi:GNAT family N-acetyltransferase [Paraburkholderia caballeronis]|uniref:Acetyltransferase (GNAT) family protein n=1 Tax=Paraburkholderia caballeronis TaxID=416943 RepID=A0A1H7SV53_9BURK|nr:GNAT family N-acetyltransferase [Paraburkholderia caballeronis]PXW25675.1 acetyltransferase (GNAT) family protein [Paraburkholderia caballeronis]PXX01282.1 acetyltransferase (GNAT) family protein [Paraburkholderia caballeronis]RAJ99365.1 acetyltransferase (GNAT) family protein [Paraburkholderia caballeronis]TDV05532.1 acetyltransferase (GNAT) family protein [Paraburkholderia caballeronis]TDV09159.1 acetyltransferase (GNAT) family protein [Paraburkholderia caballeronis]